MEKTQAIDTKILRFQTSMVIYELEQSLGKFVLDNESKMGNISDGQINDIAKREIDRGNNFDKSKLNNIVEASYFEEIFRLAIKVANKSLDKKNLEYLYDLCMKLEILNIRNSVSHPNRLFPETYWYRIASIATDPVINKLGFTSINATFRAAMRGEITIVPDDWLQRGAWNIHNNLPSTFDHDITGLIGRTKECEKVLSSLKRKKQYPIAIVAPGGQGKTALALEVLKNLCFDATFSKLYDYVFYISFKTNILRFDGVKVISNENDFSVAALKETIAEELSNKYCDGDKKCFEEFIDQFSDLKLLLCIDNLETFLINNSEEFEEFTLELPDKWRLLITSRTTLEMFQIISLEPLKKGGAIELARTYLSMRGMKNISQESIESLIGISHFNPLTIRIAIDAFIAGNKLEDAAKYAHEELLKFSFTNLIDTLSENSISILECLFALGEPTERADICNYLELNQEQVSESLKDLMKTSLITRNISEINIESVELSSSIRDLLLFNPIDIKLRENVLEKIKVQRARVYNLRSEQKKNNKNPLDWDFIPDNIPDRNKELAQSVFKAIQTKDIYSQRKLLMIVRRQYEVTPQDSFINMLRGHLLLNIGDTVRGLQYLYEASVKLEPIIPSAVLDLSIKLLQTQELEDSYNLTKWLIDNGWGDINKSNLQNVQKLYDTYWRSLIWQGKYETVLKDTLNWENMNDLLPVYGVYQATALKRIAENQTYFESTKSLEKALEIIEIIFALDEVKFLTSNIGLILIDDICKNYKNVWKNIPNSLGLKVCEFANNYLRSMINIHRDYNESDNEVKNWIKTLSEIDTYGSINPFTDEMWLRFIDEGSFFSNSEYEFIKNGFEIVTIYNIPDKKTYLFANNEYGEQFFIHRDAFKGTNIDWEQNKNGRKLGIYRGKILDKDRNAIPVREAHIIER